MEAAIRTLDKLRSLEQLYRQGFRSEVIDRTLDKLLAAEAELALAERRDLEALVIFVFIGFTPVLTTEWVHSYLNLLQMYSRGNIPDVYAWSIVPITMNITSARE
jgi:hypothetical protein